MISVILPAYNEEAYIQKNTISIIREMDRIGKDYEIIIIEESSDRTPEISEELSKKYRFIRHFHFGKRLGKGRAIEYGIRKAKGQKIIFMDADLAVELSSINPMLEALEKCDIVVGSRYNPASKTKRTLLRLILGRGYALLPRIMFGIDVDDFQCGFKGFRKEAGKDIIKYTKISGVSWDTEFLYYGHKIGYKIHEIPVKWEEKRGRSIKIGIKTIFSMWIVLVGLFVRSLFDRM